MNNPELYAKFSRLIGTASNFVLKKYLKNVKFEKENVSILDVGSGDCYVTFNLLLPKIPKKCTELVGIDISQEMVDYSTKNCQGEGVKFFKMDIGSKNIPSEFCQRFDHAFSFFCMHWIPNKRNAYENLFKMLTPEGDFLGTYIVKLPLLTNYVTMSKYPSYKPLFSKELIENLECLGNEENSTERILKETGFVNYFCTTEKVTLAWSNTDQYKQFVSSVDPVMPKLSNNERKKYMESFIEEIKRTEGITFVPDLVKDEGVVLMDYELLVVYASKT